MAGRTVGECQGVSGKVACFVLPTSEVSQTHTHAGSYAPLDRRNPQDAHGFLSCHYGWVVRVTGVSRDCRDGWLLNGTGLA